MSVKIVIFGSVNRDYIARASRLPKVGETVEGFGLSQAVGGKGANQAVQAAQLNAETYFVGCVGSDENGAVLKRSLGEKGVIVDYLNELEGQETGNCSIYVDTNGDNMLVYYPGTNKMIAQQHIDNAAGVIKSADILITQNEINQDAVIYGLKLGKNAGVRTLLNPAPALPLPNEVFALADYITPNETESEVYTGLLRSDFPFDEWKKRNAEWFLLRGVKGVCITLGEKGAYYRDAHMEISVPAYEIEPVDTTAAGDSFNAAFAYGISFGWDMEKTLRFANACGALTSMGMGAQPSIPDIGAVEAFIAERG